MFPDCRVTVYDYTAQNVLMLDAVSKGDFGNGLIKYEDTPSGCGAGQLQLGLRWEEVDARGYYRGKNVFEISAADNTLQQAITSNAYPNSDSLSGATLTGLTQGTGGPGGAADAEYTGTGSPIGSNAILDRVVSLVMGQTYEPSFFIDPSQITNNNGSTPNVLTEFSGSTQNADGSYSNVDGKTSSTAYTLASASPFSAAASIQRGTISGHIRVIIGNKTNGYSLLVEGTDGKAFVQKYVGGSLQSVSSGNFANGIGLDGAFHAYGVTVTPGTPNTIRVFCDSTVYTITDSSLTLTSGTWPVSIDTGGGSGKIRNYGINCQVVVGINTADNLTQILQQYVALNTTTAGRYATSAWVCPTNLAPNSDSLSGWTAGGFSLGTGGPGGTTDFELTGAGVGVGTADLHSAAINVSPGQMTFSAWLDPSQITSGNGVLWVLNTARNVIYGQTNIPAGPAGRYAVAATIPSGVTQVVLDFQPNNCVVASGQKLKFSQPMLEAKSSASGYYISSQNPQVHVYAELLSSAVVANGQKFKLSQPMLAKGNVSSYYVPYVTDGSTRLYLDSKEGYDPANGEDTQQAYLWDGAVLTMRIPVTGVGIDAASSMPYITCGTPLSGGGNPTSIGNYGIGTYVGRRRYCGSQLRCHKPNQRMPQASVDLIGLQKLFDGADGQTFTVNNEDVGTTVYNVLNQFTQRWPQLTITQSNFPSVGANYSGSRQNSSVTQMLSDVMSAISSGDLWVIRVGHDRTPRLIKLYDQATNTYTYNRTLPQGVVEFEPLNVSSDNQDVSNLFNSVMVIGDTDPATKQPVCAIVQDSNSISLYGQIDAQPVTNTALKTTDACVAYATALLNQSSLATSQNQFRVYLRNDATAANKPAGLSNGDVVRGVENITITRFDSTGTSRNMVPDSEMQWQTGSDALWTLSGSAMSAGQASEDGNANCWNTTVGNGSPLPVQLAGCGVIDVVAGKWYAFQGFVNADTCSAGSPGWAIYDVGMTTRYALFPQNTSAHGWVTGTWQCPNGVTQIRVVADPNQATVLSGGYVLQFAQPMLEPGTLHSVYQANYGSPNIYGLAASVQTTIDAHGDRWQDVKFSAIEPDWNADMAERANALATALRANTLTPAAIDQYVVSSDAFPASGIPTSGLTVNPPTFLALFAAGTAIETISGASFTLPASQTSWAWLNPDKSWTIKQDPSIVTGAILYAYFTTSASAVIGQTPRASVGVVKIGVGNINVASNLPAPTCTGITVQNASTPTTLSADISAALTVTNVPQDGSAYGLAYYFRQTGTSTWVPYGEETFAGLPNPAASITMPTFIFGQLQNGISYDFAVGFVALAGYGPLTTIKTALTANSIVVTVPYLIGTTSPTPTVSGITLTNQTSANGVAAAVRLQFTITNQPTDGSLRRISVWFRVHGASAWTFYTSQGVPGLPNPAASQAYDITLADLTNGQNYDFAATFENAQGQDSATPGVIYTNWAAQAINLPTTALPKIPVGATVSVSGVTINSYSGASGAAQTANVTFTPTVTPPAGDNRAFSQWGAGYLYWAKVNDSGTSDGDTNVANYVPAGSNSSNTSGSAITDTFGPLGAGHGWQLAIQPIDQQNNGGPLAIVGVTAAQTIGTGSLGDFSQAPTISSNSATARAIGSGVFQFITVTFTESDFGSASPFAKPSNLDHIELVVTVASNSDATTYVPIKASAPSSFTNTTATYSKLIHAPLGSSVSVGVRYVGANGTPGATTALSNCQGIGDPNGDFIDTGDSNGGVLYNRSFQGTRNTHAPTPGPDGLWFADRIFARRHVANALGHNILYGSAFTTTLNPWTTFGTPGGTSPSWAPDTYAGGRAVCTRNGSTGTQDYLLEQQFTSAGGNVTVSGLCEFEQLASVLSLGGGAGVWVDIFDVTSSTVLASSTALTAQAGQTQFTPITATTTAGHTIQIRLRTQFATGVAYFYKIKAEYGTIATPWDDPTAASVTAQNWDAGGNLSSSNGLTKNGAIVPVVSTSGISYTSSTGASSTGNSTINLYWDGTNNSTVPTYHQPSAAVGAFTAVNAGSDAPYSTSLNASSTYYFCFRINMATNALEVRLQTGGSTADKNDESWLNLDGYVAFARNLACSTPAVNTSGGGGTPPGGGGGGNTCPADEQILETQRGFVPARDIVAGDSVRDLDGSWNVVHAAQSVPAAIVAVRIAGETLLVDAAHAWMNPDGGWVDTLDLRLGQLLQGIDGRLYPVEALEMRGEGMMRKLRVERSRFVIGRVVGHNAITQ